MRKLFLFSITLVAMFPLIANATASTETLPVNNDTDKGDLLVTESGTKKENTFPGIEQLTGTAALTSNYIFRGISNSSNYPAAQAGLTYTFPFGFYLNAWGSNVSFTGSKASMELDTMLGYSGDAFNEDFAYNINYGRYNYPGAQDLSYNELNTVFNYKFIQAAISYSADVYATHQSGTYYNAGINYDVPSKYFFNIEDINFQALFGHYSLPRAAGNSYNDYLVAISKKIKCFTFTGAWTDTNGRQHNPPYDGSQFIGTIGAEF